MAEDTARNTVETNNLTLTESPELTTLLRKPIKDKLRIKYTCFDVSRNHIVLGSTSGSVYLFTRNTCQFQQLIPLSNGPVKQVLLSPDEKLIALVTTDGKVCLTAFKPNTKETTISLQHERDGESVTTLCWNDNSSELYIGDANGTVHVMGSSIFTVKRGIFQDPAYPIMGLNHKIIQIDFRSPYLLVSTLSNSYICDTDKGQYEQIGIRTRQGDYGACFYEDKSNESAVPFEHVSSNGSIQESQNHTTHGENLKIYCARPGSRLWEAQPNGKIIKTHNFKQALGIPPCRVRKLNDSEPRETEGQQSDWPAQSLKFSPLYVIANVYLFAYDSSALYILDPINSSVALWCNDYSDIIWARVMENQIYFMTYSGDFRHLVLTSGGSGVMNATRKPNGHSLPSKLDSGIVVVNPRHLVSSAKNGDASRSEIKDKRFVESSDTIISKVRDANDEFSYDEINQSNDLTINGHRESSENIVPYDSDDEIHWRGSSRPNTNDSKTAETKGLVTIVEQINAAKDEETELRNDIEIIYALTNEVKRFETEDDIELSVGKVSEQMNKVKKLYETLPEQNEYLFNAIKSAEQYYNSILLSKVNVDQLAKSENHVVLKKITDSFVAMNTSVHVKCTCGFSFPDIKLHEPTHFDVGKIILQKYSNENIDNCINICIRVPYMWRVYLPISQIRGVNLDEKNIAQCLQTRDDFILAFLLLLLYKKQWHSVNEYLNNLQRQRCLRCSRPVPKSDNQTDLIIDWDNVAMEMMKLEGPDRTVDVLQKIVDALPTLSLSRSIFQSIIFTRMLNKHGFDRSIDLNKKLNSISCNEDDALCCNKIQDRLLSTLEKDLGKPINGQIFGNRPHHWGILHRSTDLLCPCCTLPLQTPILLDNNGVTVFSCGHSYHVNCLVQKKKLKCILHP